MKPFEPIDTETRYRGRCIRVDEDRMQTADGRVVTFEVVRHPGAAAIVPLLDDARVILIRQYRHAIGEWILELPAGTLDGGEQAIDCAARELIEETGYRARDWLGLGAIWTTPGFTDERIELFLARGLEPDQQRLEADEAIELRLTPLTEALAMTVDGRISDGKSVAGLQRAAASLRELA
ncbi:MAG: NUDIX hydrolase [Acidobacteria bacterium]|nr:MAG: NUDIX hydrolase [Acidobacteriota bacterium]REK08431.1 MAG: NUDIX hydrolase [Acidobacteriota bacterium]